MDPVEGRIPLALGFRVIYKRDSQSMEMFFFVARFSGDYRFTPQAEKEIR